MRKLTSEKWKKSSLEKKQSFVGSAWVSMSMSPAFMSSFWANFFLSKNYKHREKLFNITLWEKAAHIMLVKLIPCCVSPNHKRRWRRKQRLKGTFLTLKWEKI